MLTQNTADQQDEQNPSGSVFSGFSEVRKSSGSFDPAMAHRNHNGEDMSGHLHALQRHDESRESLSENKVNLVRALLANIQNSVVQIEKMLPSQETDFGVPKSTLPLEKLGVDDLAQTLVPGRDDERIIEGVFDGENMVGQDGKEYTVPPNYASKSKLVEGDILKLTIKPGGSFIYKQIGPIERKRVIAELDFDSIKNQYFAKRDDKQWKLLTASVTYYKGDKGDEVIILVPHASHSNWAAVENIIKKYSY
ncbi:MAG TPA: hypothetical protein VJA22_00345 [Patescibacteria group bacterium]|nr:hypothetical protein [Patescibacteria group bacterium]